MTVDREPVYECHLEPDQGFRLSDGGRVEAWEGWRVRYRPLTGRPRGRWRTFLLDEAPPSVAALQHACRVAAERNP